MNLGGQGIDAGLLAAAFFLRKTPRESRHDRRGQNRKQRDEDERDIHPSALQRSLNSTAASTITSIATPCRRAGANRHCRTACAARSFKLDSRPRTTLTSLTEPSLRTTIS